MSKIFVVGGSGRVATELIKDLIANGNQVVAGSRHPEKIWQNDNVTPVELDLHADVAKIADLMKDTSAVYFVAGSRGHDLLQTDAMGAVKTMKAAEQNGIKRYVMLSSMFALEPDKWSSIESLASITDYNIAKFFADNYLISNTDLDYTIFQPAVLKEQPGTGKITVGPESKDGYIPIPDVAKALADSLNEEHTFEKVIMLQAGDTPIDDAFKAY